MHSNKKKNLTKRKRLIILFSKSEETKGETMARYTRSSWNLTNIKELDPKLTQQVFSTGSIMLVRYVYEPGLHFPEHSHPQEQVTMVEQGTLEYDIDGEKVILTEGDICSIPSNVPHSTVVGKKRAVAISIFTPVREDVIIKPE
jgi:quercetin dioxygenase-like cupin family protein